MEFVYIRRRFHSFTRRYAHLVFISVSEICGINLHLHLISGYKVSDTVRKGILDVSLYNNTEKELMLGSLAALGESERERY